MSKQNKLSSLAELSKLKEPKEKFKEISSKIEFITPQIAREILAKNSNNRALKPSLVKYYMREIANGKWDVNGESIKIATDGALLDGQHRLEAISKGNKGVYTYVVRGLHNGAFLTIDCGKPRTHGDFLKIAGFEGNHTLLAASARIAMSFSVTGEVTSSQGRIPPEAIVDFVEKNQGLIESMSKLQQKVGKLLPNSIAIGCHYVFSIIDMEKSDEFFHLLTTGENLKEGNPILSLRNRLFSHRGDGRAGEGHRRMLMYFVVHAFNAYMDGREIKNIPYKTEFDVFLKGFEASVMPNWGK